MSILLRKKITPEIFLILLRSAGAALHERLIIRVATDCGFNNVAYFISVFREQRGMPPPPFRREYGKK